MKIVQQVLLLGLLRLFFNLNVIFRGFQFQNTHHHHDIYGIQ